jgi:hypothetical protein
MKIQIMIKNVYGEEKAYPVCKMAQGFANVAGTKTLTRSTLREVLSMGFTIDLMAFGIVAASFNGRDNVNLPANIR